MTLSARFSGVVKSIAEIKEYLLAAEALGHTDRTVIGVPGVGLEIWIETGQIAQTYRCSAFHDCNSESSGERLARQIDTNSLLMPYHQNTRQYTCPGSGKPAVEAR